MKVVRFYREHDIQNGGIGGGTTAVFCDPSMFPRAKAALQLRRPIVLNKVLSIPGLSGIICHDDTGEIILHIHIALNDEHGTPLCGTPEGGGPNHADCGRSHRGT